MLYPTAKDKVNNEVVEMMFEDAVIAYADAYNSGISVRECSSETLNKHYRLRVDTSRRECDVLVRYLFHLCNEGYSQIWELVDEGSHEACFMWDD